MTDWVAVAEATSKPAVKLIETISNGIGTLYEPTKIRKLADAKAYEIQKIGEAMRDNSDVPILYNQGALTLDTKDFREFAERTQSRLAYQEMLKQANIEKVAGKAYQLLESEEEVENNPVDQDWTIRFFNCVEDVSNEKMQEIWAKILAGEVKKTGSFSMRTLETLKNISQKEAETFQKILPFVIMASDDNMFVLPSGEWNEGNYSYSDVMLLDECGLISSTPFIHHRLDLENNETRMLFNKKKTLIIKSVSEKEEKISIEIYTLTKTGTELYNILSFEPDDQYLENLAKYIFDKHKNKIEVYVYKTEWYNSEAVSYDDKTVFAEYK